MKFERSDGSSREGESMRGKTKPLKLKEYSFGRNRAGYFLIAPAVISIYLLSVYPMQPVK